VDYLSSFILSYALVGTSAGLVAIFLRWPYYKRAPHKLNIAQRAVRDGRATTSEKIGLFFVTFAGCIFSPMHIGLIVFLGVAIGFIF
jgi:hypothetical protein